MAELLPGALAPDFELPSSGGTIRLSQLRGKPVVIFFYPKDDTSACTTEATDFSALKPAFDSLGVSVLGISPDSLRRHERFSAKHGLTVDLLSDEERTALEAYGVWTEKTMYGRKYMGVERTTFLIDAAGTIARIWRKVKVKGHAQEVLAAAGSL